MGVNHHVKTKYVLRLPLSFLKPKRTNVKGKSVDDSNLDYEDGAGAYADVAPPVHVRYESESEIEVGSDDDADPLDINHLASEQSVRERLVSWTGVQGRAQCRWTIEQEKKLVYARAELARCQKAWSSEQEVWLKCIERLNEEKEAHEDFVNNRGKHMGDEQLHFRKACDRNRRRSEQDQLEGQPQHLTQAHRTGSLPVRLGRFRGRS